MRFLKWTALAILLMTATAVTQEEAFTRLVLKTSATCGATVVSGSPVMLCAGTADPESNVYGEPGWIYFRKTVGVYRKADGSGNDTTGWAAIGAGAGDFSSNTSSSVDGEIVLFSGTGGKTGKRATGTGLGLLTSGVLSALAVTDDSVPVGNGTTYQVKTIGDCDDSAGNHLNYDTATNAFSCGTSSSGGGSKSIGITIDGGGSAITTGVKGFVVVADACTVVSATLLSTDASATAGDIVIDVWKDTYANYPPANADSITASAPPTLSGANKSQDSTLTGWTTSVSAGDVIGFNVDSATTVTRVTLILKCS